MRPAKALLLHEALRKMKNADDFSFAYLPMAHEDIASELGMMQIPFEKISWEKTERKEEIGAFLICNEDDVLSQNAIKFLKQMKCACLVLAENPENLVNVAKLLEQQGYWRSCFLSSGVGLYEYLTVSNTGEISENIEKILNQTYSDINDYDMLRKEYLKLVQRNKALEQFYDKGSREIESIRQAYTQIANSKMWKITAPIRWMLTDVKKVGTRLKGQVVRDGEEKISKKDSEFQNFSTKVQKFVAPPIPVIAAHKASVDIIICIYNALDDVKLCIESVMKCTNDPYHIILVDDNSENPTRSFLEEVSAENPLRFTLIQNDGPNAKHGYTYASNIGLHASHADYVILLNSDTIVTDGWVDRMITCAQSDERIGVVGPLSNTASWQSIPEISGPDGDWAHNLLPNGYDVEGMGKKLNENSGHIYPKVRLLNGFCLMLTRKVINEIGYMDEKTFGRGFAEEDDYNSRCIKAGFKLAVADDTYVFHSQSKSYSNEKRMQLSALSGEALRKKHGTDFIEQSCAQTLEHFVMDSIRHRTKMMFERTQIIDEGRRRFKDKKILFLLPASNAGGGSNVVIQEAIAMQKMGAKPELLNLFSCKEGFEQSYPDISIPCRYVKSFFETEHEAIGFDAVCGTLFSTMRYCDFKDLKQPPQVAYYIQDYEPYFFENKFSDEYIEAKKSYTLIDNCINVTKTQWNRNTVRSRTGAECIVLGPSVNIDLFRPRKENSSPEQYLTIVAMVRPTSPRRGPAMTVKILRRIKEKFPNYVKIKIFGCDPEKEQATREFFEVNPLDFECINYGELSPQETSTLLAQSDVFADFSTFQAMGLTGMEAMASGCAVILPIYGGAGEFARDGENCLLIDTLNEETCYAALDKLCTDYVLRTEISRNAYRDMCKYYPEKSAYRFLDAVFKQ